MSKETYHRLTEQNSWEGETWYHYFLDEPGVYESLRSLMDRLENESDFTDIETVELSDDEATTLANIDEGYMQPHWFGVLDIDKLNTVQGYSDLYKGQIRNYAEDLFETVKVEV